MIAARIIRPHTRLATTRWWQDTTLETEFDIEGAHVDELYEAMDWLLARQDRIQARLARRHFVAGGLVLFDISSSYFEGSHCPLARHGYSRSGKKGKLQIDFGLLCDVRGRPAAVSVMEGNIADTETLLPEIERLRTTFGLERLAIVGDRGMISQAWIELLRPLGGIDWITALKSASIKKPIRMGTLQPRRFDDAKPGRDPAPGLSWRAPGRLPQRASGRTSRPDPRNPISRPPKRTSRRWLSRSRKETPAGEAEIALRIGEQINHSKMKKHFEWQIAANRLHFRRTQDSIAQEAALDGIYVIRTSLPEADMSAADCVRNCRALTRVERAFRSLEDGEPPGSPHPPSHRQLGSAPTYFLCMLDYYVEWNMCDAWSKLLFARSRNARKSARTRDPVAPRRARRGCGAKGGHRVPRRWLACLLLPNPHRTSPKCQPQYLSTEVKQARTLAVPLRDLRVDDKPHPKAAESAGYAQSHPHRLTGVASQLAKCRQNMATANARNSLPPHQISKMRRWNFSLDIFKGLGAPFVVNAPTLGRTTPNTHRRPAKFSMPRLTEPWFEARYETETQCRALLHRWRWPDGFC